MSRLTQLIGGNSDYAEFNIRLANFLLDRLNRKKSLEKEDWIKSMDNHSYLMYFLRNLLLEVSMGNDLSAIIRAETISALRFIWYENYAMNLGRGYIHDFSKWEKLLNEDIAANEATILSEKRNPLIPKELKESTSIWQIPKTPNKPALIIAAGPSIRERNHIKYIAEHGWKGPIITTDRMLRPLLEAGVSPENGFDLKVATVDGHRILIPKMYRKVDGKPLNADGVDGMMITTAAPQTYVAANESGIDVKWFHGMMDDFDDEDSMSGAMSWMVACPAVSAGGNVGATCWTLSTYLRANPIVYVGLDLGYTPDTRVEDTAYYDTLIKGGAPHADIVRSMQYGHNPDFDCDYMQDHVFVNYKQALLEMIRYRNEYEVVLRKNEPGVYPVDVINATEGGSFHGPGVTSMKLADVVNKYGGN